MPVDPEPVDNEALILSLIGYLPLGDIVKDQIASRLHRNEMNFIEEALGKLNKKYRQLANQENFKRNLQINSMFLFKALNSIRGEYDVRKRNLITNLLFDIIEIEHDMERADWLFDKCRSISMQAFDVLFRLGSVNSAHMFQHHSHVSALADMEKKYGYPYMMSLLKELDNHGLISLQIDHSSRVGANSRFIVFWTEVSNELIKYLKDQ